MLVEEIKYAFLNASEEFPGLEGEDEEEVEEDVEVDEEVVVHVTSEFPNTNSLILSVFRYDQSSTSAVRLGIKSKVILNGKNPELSAANCRPVLQGFGVIKGKVNLPLSGGFDVDLYELPSRERGRRQSSPGSLNDVHLRFHDRLCRKVAV